MHEVVAAVAGGRTATLVWVNEVGGRTFAVGAGAGRCFLKWAPAGSGLDLAAEADRMAWARRFHPVPEPLASGSVEAGSWLVTAALPGDNAVSARWQADPATAVTAIGEGLRALQETLPVASCPFGAPNGTTAPAGTASSSAPTGLRPTRNGPATTGCCTTSAPDYA